MKKPSLLKRICLTVAVCLAASMLLTTVHAEFIRQAAITTGTARSLYSTLQSVGYAGNPEMDEVSICNITGNSVNLYLGSDSSVNASSGFPLEPASCMSYRSGARGVHSDQIFIFTSSQQNAALSIRER